MSNRKMNTSFQNDSIFSFKRAVYDHFLEQFRTEGEKTLLKRHFSVLTSIWIQIN